MFAFLTLVLAAICPIVLAWIGIHVSLNPSQDRKTLLLMKVWFCVIAAIGVAAVVAGGFQSNAVQQATKDGVDKILDIVRQQARSDARPALSPQNVQDLISLLTAVRPDGITVNIMCLGGDTNSCLYGQQWLSVLKSAGWSADGPLPLMAIVPPLKGIVIVVNSQATPGAGALQHALSTVGITAVGQISPTDVLPTQIKLLIGGGP